MFFPLRIALPAVLVCVVLLCRLLPSWAEVYARCVYPAVSAVLSAFSALFPFSLEEVLVVGVVLWAIVFPAWKRKKGMGWRQIAVREVELLAWIYIWFYLGWGLNYFRHSIYERTQTQPVQYDEQAFRRFLSEYTDSLNRSYLSEVEIGYEVMEQDIRTFYCRVPSLFGLVLPKNWQRPKFFTFTSLYSRVGVLGSMGPFFAEAQLNADLLPVQLPFTYAHEFAHLLGISSEAEANYWAYQACTRSSLSGVRYSGYFGLLPYVLGNASFLLPEEQFKEWVQRIRPEIVREYEEKRAYWTGRYSPWLGSIQNVVYDLFLKGNNIPSGKKNYAEVVGILMSVPYGVPGVDLK